MKKDENIMEQINVIEKNFQERVKEAFNITKKKLVLTQQ